ncbi:hydrogenase maturation protease [Kibdelosporangium lantanae]
MSTVVIGIGNPYRSDDGVGPTVADLIADMALPDVDVVIADGEPTRLLDAWAGVDLAVVVDAVLCDPPQPGRIHRTNLDNIATIHPSTSSHGMGIPEAVVLGAALDQLPRRLVVLAVEAAELGFGTDPSPDVAAALPGLVSAVLREIGEEPHVHPT